MKEAVIGLVLSLLTGLVGTVVYAAKAWVQAHFKPQQLTAVRNLAQQAVQAAEQFGIDFEVVGKDKFEFAKRAVIAGAAKLGLKLSDEEIMAFIQAAVADLKSQQAYVEAMQAAAVGQRGFPTS